jgi:hypothetical protein
MIHRRTFALLALPAMLLTTRAGRAADDGMYPQLPDFGAPSPPERSGPPPAPPPPRAPEPASAAFGAPGQVVLRGDASASAFSSEFSGSQASQFSLSFTPSFDVFVVRHVSVGLGASLSYTNAQGYGADNSLVQTRTNSVSVGPRLGVDIPLGRTFSLWPEVTLAVESVHRDEKVLSGSSASIAGSPIAAPSTTLVGPSIDVFVPLLVHPGPHFFIGFGPEVFHEFGKAQGQTDVGGQRTTVGAGLEVGGYFGGRPGPADEQRPRPASKSFGEANELVITNEEVLAGHSTTYAGTGASNTYFSATLGVDYFIASYVSFGGFLTGSYTNAVGFEPSGAEVTYTSESFGGGPRLGVNVPLGRWVSIYPRVALGFGPSSSDEKSGQSENGPSSIAVWMAASMPLLVHPAPHVFAGFGPTFNHDLWHAYSYPNQQAVQNAATTIGAGLLVGGWL